MHWVTVACVVPDLTQEIQRAFSHQPLLEVSGASPFLGYSFTYPHPPELGADRLADAAALFHYGQFPAVSINCGTATVFNVLDSQGRFMGGVIQPGLELIREALPSRAAGLRRFKGRELELSSLGGPKIGRSTGAALESGTLSTFRGGVCEALRQIEEELGAKPKVYLTGGNARFLGEIAANLKIKALLTLTGLNIIAEQWRSRSEIP
jgi:type III pantothenate kinase